MMLRLSILVLATAFAGQFACYGQEPQSKDSPPGQQGENETRADSKAPAVLPRLREYRGVKLDMNRADVKAMLGKPDRGEKEMEEYKLGGDDLMTLRYDDEGKVRTIQLYFTAASRAPAWTDVIDQAEIQSLPTGAKLARAVHNEDKFWVTMFQNKEGSVTTITISR